MGIVRLLQILGNVDSRNTADGLCRLVYQKEKLAEFSDIAAGIGIADAGLYIVIHFTFKHFPYQIVTALFCLAQVLIYLYQFTPTWLHRAIGFGLPLAAVLVYSLLTSRIDVNGTVFLPDHIALSENAEIATEGSDAIQVSIYSYGEDSMLSVSAKDYGIVIVRITDGDQTYQYHIEVYEDDNGNVQTKVEREN